MVKQLKALLLALLIAAGVTQAQAAAVAYMSGPSEPWGVTSNVSDMDSAFGAGNWDRINFGAGFGGYDFLYVDGGNGQSGAFFGWVDANRAALEGFVLGGGNLFLNAAGWSGGSHAMLFGTTLVEGSYSGNGYAIDPGHGLFAGAGLQWSGNYFSHDALGLVAGMTALIRGDGGQTILAEGAFGGGFFMLGGQTSSYFHSSVNGSNPSQLRVNELLYAANFAGNDVPEPATLVLLGIGLAGIGFARRRG